MNLAAILYLGKWGHSLRFPREWLTTISHLIVIPAEAGIQEEIAAQRIIQNWIPASAGMTE